MNAQVLGVSVDFPDANRAFAEKLGLTYPLLSDRAREMSRAYESIFDDAAMVNTSRISVYLRAKRAWFVIDKEGIIRYMKVGSKQLVPSDELIDVVKKYQ